MNKIKDTRKMRDTEQAPRIYLNPNVIPLHLAIASMIASHVITTPANTVTVWVTVPSVCTDRAAQNITAHMNCMTVNKSKTEKERNRKRLFLARKKKQKDASIRCWMAP
jgi:hypothetical protein